MSTTDTTEDILTDRLVSTATIAIVECETVDDGPGSWIRPTVLAIQAHLAAELIAFEQLVGRPLSLQEVLPFLLQGMEWELLEGIANNLHSPPPPPPTLAQAREADLNTPAGRDMVRDFLATLAKETQA